MFSGWLGLALSALLVLIVTAAWAFVALRLVRTLGGVVWWYRIRRFDHVRVQGDGPLSLVCAIGVCVLALWSIVAFIRDSTPLGLIAASIGLLAAITGFAWFWLRVAYELALVELGYLKALRRLAKVVARHRPVPAAGLRTVDDAVAIAARIPDPDVATALRDVQRGYQHLREFEAHYRR